MTAGVGALFGAQANDRYGFPRLPRLRSGRPAYRRGAVAVRKRLRCAIGLGVSTLFLLTLIACVDPLWRPDDHGDTPEAATDMEPAVPVSGRLETAADVDYFRVATGAAGVRVVASTDSQDTVVRIEGLVAESTNEDHLDWGDLPSPRPEHVHVRVSGAQPASYELAVWVVTAPEPGAADGFDIELRYLGTEPSATQQEAVAAAARFWEAVIAGGLPDLPIPTSDWGCEEDDPSLFGGYVDDLLIYVRVAAIDGADGVAAQSTICARRAAADGGLPFIGSVTFDMDDLAMLETSSYLQRLAMRQIAQVLGFGLLWDEQPFALLEEPSVGPDGAAVAGRDTHFAGPHARRAFAEIGGDAYAGAAVPVENDTDRYGSGVLDLSWRESVFGGELMSTVLDAPDAPLSTVTVASLADLGYEVDYAAAEPYALPAPAAEDAPGTQAQGGPQIRGRGIRRASITVAELPAGLVPGSNRQGWE